MSFFLFYVCLFIFFADTVIGIVQWKNMDKAMRVFCTLIALSFSSEVIGAYVEYRLQTKAPVYHFFSIGELFLYAVYFFYTINVSLKRWQILCIGLICVFLGLGNLYFFQPLKQYNTNMLMIECFLIIAMSLFALFKILLRENLIDVVRFAHFKIWTAVLVLWTSTFFFWAFLNYLRESNSPYYASITIGQVVINILVYTFIGLSFLKLKK